MKFRETTEPAINGLVWSFIHAAPVRASAVISGVVSLILLSTFLTLQSFEQSGAQQADSLVGSADYSVQTPLAVALGSDGSLLDSSLVSSMRDAGAIEPRISYYNYDGLTIENGPTANADYQENDWQDRPFPNRLSLSEGRWPRDESEIAVSSTLGKSFALESEVELFGGQWRAEVVGVVNDESARTTQTIFASPGTWNSLATRVSTGADRFDQSAARTLSWSGGNADSVLTAVSAELDLSEDASSSSLESLHQQLLSRDELIARAPSSLLEFSLAALVAPFLGSFVGVIFAVRFVNRIRAVMLSIGISRQRTRASAMVAILLSVVTGTLVGCAFGLGIGLALRPVLDHFSYRTIGPVHSVFGLIGATVMVSALGAAAAALFGSSSRRASARTALSIDRVPLRFVLFPLASVVIAIGGVIASQVAANFDERILSGMALAVAGVTLLPLVLEVVLVREPHSFPALLATRRLRSVLRSSGWVISVVALLLVLSFGVTTFLYSAVVTTNNQSESIVPPRQVHVATPDDMPSMSADQLSAEIEEYAGISDPIRIHTADGGVDLFDGATLVVDDVDDFQALTGLHVSDRQRALLLNGGTLRTKGPDVSEVNFVTSAGVSMTFPASLLEDIDPSFRYYDGFILALTAENLGFGLVNETRVYTDVSDDSMARASGASTEIGFNSEWLRTYAAPDVVGEPLDAQLSAGAIALLAVAVMIFYAASTARTLRPNLAILRSVGVGQPWLGVVLFIQTGTVLAIAFLGAVLSAVLGMFAMIRLGGIQLTLSVPWQSIGVATAVLVIGTVVATLIATRKLVHNESLSLDGRV